MSAIPGHARPHHWGFANAWLRRSFQRIPETLVSAIARAQTNEPLVDSWKNFAKTLEEEDRIDGTGLAAESFSAEVDRRWYLAVVQMPPAERTGEAHRIVLAVAPPEGRLDPEAEGESIRDGTEIRYFVLELAGPEETLLVEWEGDEREETTKAPANDPQAIASAVRDLLITGDTSGGA